MKRYVLGVLLSAGLVAGCSTPEATVNIMSAQPLTSAQQAELKNMQRDGHFGAMAASPDGAWAWAAGYNALAAARSDAIALCNIDVLSGADCEVIVELLPVGEAPQVGGKTLTVEAAGAFTKHQTRQGASAFAIAADGTHGHGWGYDSVAQAEERALAECNSRNEARASEAQRDGLPVYPCDVIWTKPALMN